jgi:hypothetical protein
MSPNMPSMPKISHRPPVPITAWHKVINPQDVTSAPASTTSPRTILLMSRPICLGKEVDKSTNVFQPILHQILPTNPADISRIVRRALRTARPTLDGYELLLAHAEEASRTGRWLRKRLFESAATNCW